MSLIVTFMYPAAVWIWRRDYPYGCINNSLITVPAGSYIEAESAGIGNGRCLIIDATFPGKLGREDYSLHIDNLPGNINFYGKLDDVDISQRRNQFDVAAAVKEAEAQTV